MKNLSYLLYFVCMAVAFSASTTEIETLRSRVQDSSAELTDSEKGVISKFWSASLDQMMLSKSSLECVEVRRQLAEQKGNEFLSDYAVAYVAEAKGAIESAFGDAQRMEEADQRQMVERNLMILTGELKSPDLAPLGLERLDAEDDVVQYWAFKAVTDPGVVQQLTSDIVGDEKMTEIILTALHERLSGEVDTQIQKLVVRFCLGFDNPLARDILLLIADGRIEAYRNWTVTDEALDVSVLSALGNIAVLREDPADKSAFGRKFAELYALTIQRYLKGKDSFSRTEIGEMMTVIAEVDQSVLAKTMGIKTGILPSLKRKSGMEREYETLFGDRMRSGLLADKFKFDYGKDDSGKPITVPQELEPMPEKSPKQD
ncbi:MAG: hypothetical protein ACYSSJ_06370 [Planctomycetota bacterium]|jgi:hypothetical protein